MPTRGGRLRPGTSVGAVTETRERRRPRGPVQQPRRPRYSLPRRLRAIRQLAPSDLAQRLILDQVPVDIQKPDGVVLERRAGAVIAEVDAGTLLDRVDHAESITLIAPIQIGHVDTIVDTVVSQVA